MISTDLFRSDLLSSDDALRKNPVPTLRKEPREFYNGAFAGVLLLVTSRNRFGKRKNLPNRGETQMLILTGEIDEKMDALVTTSHLLRPNELRRAAFLLPFSRPNSDFFGGNCTKTGSPGPNRLFRR